MVARVAEPVALRGSITGTYYSPHWERPPSRAVLFTDISKPDTTAVFTVPGIHRLTLKASGVEGVVSDTVTVTVAPLESTGTSLEINSAPGDPIGRGWSGRINPEDGDFSVWYDRGTLHFLCPSPHSRPWYVSLGSAYEAPLIPGAYEEAGTPGGDPAAHTIGASNEQWPTKTRGRFEIKKITFGPENTLVSLWATFEQFADGANVPLKGEIRYNANSTARSVNQAPRPLAGPPQYIYFGEDAALTARVIDDSESDGSVVNTTWSVSYGPGEVSFNDPHELSTTASFSKPGRYVLVLTADDGEFTRTDSLFISVVDPEDETSLVIESGQGGPLGGGHHVRYTAIDGDFDGSRSSCNHVGILFTAGTHSTTWLISFLAPANAPLEPGVYEGPMRTWIYDHEQYRRPYFAITKGSEFAEPVEARFVVHRAIYRDSQVISFWATFEMRMEPDGVPLRGEIRFHANSNELGTNLKPGVWTDSSLLVRHGEPAILRGVAGDDDLPSPGALQTQWTKVEGPGEVAFAEASALNTEASFSKPGRYRLRLTASDGELSASSTIQVHSVDPNGNFRLTLFRESGSAEGGISESYSPLDGQIWIYGASSSIAVVFTPSDPTRAGWTITLKSGKLQKLEPGIYFDPPEMGDSDDTPKIEVNRATNDGSGSFAIRQWETADAGGRLYTRKLWFSFTYREGDSPIPLTGEFLWDADNGATFPLTTIVCPDVELTRYGSARLWGDAADGEHLGDSIRTEWTKVSGLGEVVFADSSARVTTASFSHPGDYIVRFTAISGEERAFRDVAVRQLAVEMSLRLFGSGIEDGFFTPQATNLSFNTDEGRNNLLVEYTSIASTPPQTGFVNIVPPSGSELTEGVYDPAGPCPNQAWVSLSTGSEYYSSQNGRIEVRRLARDLNGTITSVWIFFWIPHEGKYISGDIRLNVAVNNPPSIAFAEEEIWTFGQVAPLLATIEDYDLPESSELKLQWSAPQSGALVTFESPQAASTVAHFGAPGSYLVQLTASDGDAQTTARVLVHVQSPKGRWSGIFSAPNGEGRAFVRIAMENSSRYTGVLYLAGETLRFKGSLDLLGSGRTALVSKAGPLELILSSGPSGTLAARLAGAGADLTVDLHSVPSGERIPVPAGQYALVFENPTPASSEEPAGTSWARATVRGNGNVRIALTLADGTRHLGSLELIGDRQIQSLIPLGKSGAIAIHAFFHDSTAQWTGEAVWARQADRRAPGFNAGLTLRGTPAMKLLKHREPFTGGTSPIAVEFRLTFQRLPPAVLSATIHPGGKVTNFVGAREGAVLLLNADGTFHGQFVTYVGRQVQFSGTILRDAARGVGFGLCEDESGVLEIAPLNGAGIDLNY